MLEHYRLGIGKAGTPGDRRVSVNGQSNGILLRSSGDCPENEARPLQSTLDQIKLGILM